ncbi:mitochondrial carrier domain-containing protein [Syncephalastrum racemosum]|uniref:Mitochondrial carrier domain-containing protein n=1 Tax=Syncephalastrum racemosum TaxID=13706 RepID=A0A1X2H9B0_SYNRA|nr:mitochondrial carrier domain-containing protein [Syncephalastrum racemosum]
MAPATSQPVDPNAPLEKKPVSWNNLLLGATLNLFEVSTLGQPFEVLKTQMAANRGQSIFAAAGNVWQRGGVLGFYQGLIPWAWIEASTKGAVLLFTASEFEFRSRAAGASPFMAGLVGGMTGGIAQAYSTMGFCTFMKTVEVTRHKSGAKVSTMKVASDIFKKEGIRGINKGVNAVAVRQCTNWASRFGISRWAQESIVKARHPDNPNAKATATDRVLSSMVGGALSCWNQPIEVIRIEMQSQVSAPGRPDKMTIATAAKWIYKNSGTMGFFKGVVPRIGLGMWQTVCMVTLGDTMREYFGTN